MFQIQNVKIFPHRTSLAEACRKIRDADFVHGGIRRAYSALSALTGKRPTLAVAALNPTPVKALGTEIEGPSGGPAGTAGRHGRRGPRSADSVFHFARKDL